MSSKYTIWLNYDNDKKKYQLPVNPEKVQFKVNGKASTSDIDNLGTLVHKGKRDTINISWSSFFPAKFASSYCSCTAKKFKSPNSMHKWILTLMNASNPLHLVFSGGPFNLNIYAVITSYTATEVGGDPGTLQYSIDFKEYRSISVTKIKKKKTTTSKKRVSNKQNKKTYKIKKGDCLWNIAKKYYGSGSKYTKILKANKSTLDKAAKKHGFSNSKNGNRLFPGTTITIP